jgi:hypothetical protein
MPPDVITFVLHALMRLPDNERFSVKAICVHWEWTPADTQVYAAAYPIGLRYSTTTSRDSIYEKHRCRFLMGGQ